MARHDRDTKHEQIVRLQVVRAVSDCACGKRVMVHVDAAGPAVGLGPKVTGSYSDVTFFDPSGCPDADVFNGLFTMASAGVTIGARPFRANAGFGPGLPGVSAGWAQIRLGGADSEPFQVGPTIGRDLSVSGVVGTSTVTYAKEEPCCGK